MPRDGRVADLSDRGLRLLTREPHQRGETVAVSLALPDEDELLTASGTVRWCAEAAEGRRWYATGLEWSALDETSRYRLHTFLQQRIAQRRDTADRPEPWGDDRMRWWWVGLVALGAALIVLVAFVLSVLHTNRVLDGAVSHRNAVITRLERQGAQLVSTLEVTQTRLHGTLQELEQLERHAQQLADEAGRLSEDVQQVQAAYAQARADRERLIDEVISLERHRLELGRRLSSIPDLRLAIRDAVEARAQEDRLRMPPAWLPTPDTVWGNRGFVLKDGVSTLGPEPGGPWIKVHEPEALSAAPAADEPASSSSSP